MEILGYKNILISTLILLIGFVSCQKGNSSFKPRTESFDDGWHFIKADPSGAELAYFDDSGWRTLDLPHDWSIENLPDQVADSVSGPFSKASVGKMSTAYTLGGTGWYRKNFTLSKNDDGKIIYLRFDGVYMISDVWVNGEFVGNNANGYTSFNYDITPFLNPTGQSNVVAVRVKNEGLNTRWYSGSGIYRHTWLTKVNPLHIEPWGVNVTTPEINSDKATVSVTATVKNLSSSSTKATYNLRIINSEGTEVTQSSVDSNITVRESAEINQVLEVTRPELWSLDNPNMYKLIVEIVQNNVVIDKTETPFGIHTIHFDAEDGFTLNGETILIKGGCIHHDNGPLGAVAIDRAEERKIELLKNAGYNAVRSSHNPPSPYLLDVCDRIGMLVIEEAFDAWGQSKIEWMSAMMGFDDNIVFNDYSFYFKENWKKDIRSMMLRDRNHPSVIMWSIGNEIAEAADSSGLRIAKQIVEEVKKYDETRPVTEAHVLGMGMEFSGGQEQRAKHLALMDVVGYNYAHATYEGDHENNPKRVMYASESWSSMALENWQTVENLPYVIGNFTWTAMDYLGESGLGLARLVDDNPNDNTGSNFMAQMMQLFKFKSWPIINAFSGDFDLIGNPKPQFFYQEVVWRKRKLSMFVHTPIPEGKKEITSPWGFPDVIKSWNWEGYEGEKMIVQVYSRGEKVRLELNGEVVGEQIIDDSKSIVATFEVPYEPGELTAYCIENGKEVGEETIKTVGRPSALRLTADQTSIINDKKDLSYVMVEILDSDGNLVANADDVVVNFEVSENGEIVAAGSGDPTDLSGFNQPFKKSWHGKCLAIVRSKGNSNNKMVLTANAEALESSTIEIVTVNN
ncbi:glycoside hydrolase family 2 TIM barrel-domain containing protein [uncultured Draconibacterium sp.]|uniref:glycoside hydrolase family 2 TIM barrel-domain containing protein n=1 Tax=uncultured Draconibacterium sp. TaxID=1573823 RepID=UPI003217B215